MRRYWSVILLGARGVTGKLLALLAALAAAEAALLLATGGLSGMIPAVAMEVGHLAIAFRAALLILAAVCCLWGSDIRGGRCAYTLGRLRVSEMTAVMLWGLCYALAFLALMGFQLLLLLGLCWWGIRQSVGAATGQWVFLAAHRDALFHALLPLEDRGLYVRNAAYALSLGMNSSLWAFWSRHGGAGWVLYPVLALTVIFFPVETYDNGGIVTGLLALAMTAAALLFAWKEVSCEAD